MMTSPSSASAAAAARRGDPRIPSINGDFSHLSDASMAPVVSSPTYHSRDVESNRTFTQGDFSSFSDASSAPTTPVTSPTDVHGKGERKEGWLLGSTRAKEQGRDGDGDGGGATIQSGSPSLPSIQGSPSHEADESAATLNELAARRAQMEVVRSAAASYHAGLCVPAIEPSRPRSTAATSSDHPPSGSGGSGIAKSLSGSNAKQSAAHRGSSMSSQSGEEIELPFALECEACAMGEQCEWRPAESADSSNAAINRLSVPSNWRSLASSHIFSPSGIPAAHRAGVWLACLDLEGGEQREAWERYYGALVNQVERVSTEEMQLTDAAVESVKGGNASNESQATASSPASSSASPSARTSSYPIAFREVLKDVERTFPNTSLFAHAGGPGQQALQRVLLAFSIHRSIIGYCQSLSFLAALVLMVFHSLPEHLAFAVTCHVLEGRLAYYTRSMLGCVMDARVLRDLLSRYESDLASTLQKHAVSVEHFSAAWLLCCFVGTPLEPHAAARVWDVQMVLGERDRQNAAVSNGPSDLSSSLGSSVSLACGLALFSLHRSAFLSVTRPTPEALMNVLSKIVGATTGVEALVEKMREYLLGADREQGSSSAASEFSSLVHHLRRYHRHHLTLEFTHLPSSRVRRYARSTGQSNDELQRLWTAFSSTHPEGPWAVHVNGVIQDLLHWRLALARAVFPSRSEQAEHHSHHGGGGGQHKHHHEDGDGGGGGGIGDEDRSEAERWKASGVAAAAFMPHASRQSPCTVCIPPLPTPVHLATAPTALRTCPRCTWAMESKPDGETDKNSTEAASSALQSTKECTCRCGCAERGLLQSPACPPSVFSILFHYFDSSSFHSTSTPPGSASSASSAAAAGVVAAGLGLTGGSRGYIDFEVFVRACWMMTQSSREERLAAVFCMAGGKQEPDDETGDFAAGSTPPPSSSPRVSPSFSPSPSPSSSPAAPRGRILRHQFESFVQAFEELYHGTSVVTISANQQQQQRGASVQPIRMLSSLASAKMFIAMSFEKERQNDRARANSCAAAEDGEEEHEEQSSSLLSATGSPDDSLSYESFAAFIVLHPLISGFFRLDHIVD
jgi:hypothetical protein